MCDTHQLKGEFHTNVYYIFAARSEDVTAFLFFLFKLHKPHVDHSQLYVTEREGGGGANARPYHVRWMYILLSHTRLDLYTRKSN